MSGDREALAEPRECDDPPRQVMIIVAVAVGRLTDADAAPPSDAENQRRTQMRRQLS